MGIACGIVASVPRQFVAMVAAFARGRRKANLPPNQPVTFRTASGYKTYNKKSEIARRLTVQFLSPIPYAHSHAPSPNFLPNLTPEEVESG